MVLGSWGSGHYMEKTAQFLCFMVLFTFLEIMSVHVLNFACGRHLKAIESHHRNWWSLLDMGHIILRLTRYFFILLMVMGEWNQALVTFDKKQGRPKTGSPVHLQWSFSGWKTLSWADRLLAKCPKLCLFMWNHIPKSLLLTHMSKSKKRICFVPWNSQRKLSDLDWFHSWLPQKETTTNRRVSLHVKRLLRGPHVHYYKSPVQRQTIGYYIMWRLMHDSRVVSSCSLTAACCSAVLKVLSISLSRGHCLLVEAGWDHRQLKRGGLNMNIASNCERD